MTIHNAKEHQNHWDKNWNDNIFICLILGFDFHIFLKCMISCLRNALKIWKAQLLVINYNAYIIKIKLSLLTIFFKWIIFWVHILLPSSDFLFIVIKLYSLGLNASWGPMILSVLVLFFAFILSHMCSSWKNSYSHWNHNFMSLP